MDTNNIADRIKDYYKRKKLLLLSIASIILLPFLTLLVFNLVFIGKIYPGIRIAGINVGGLSVKKASEKLSGKIAVKDNIVLVANQQELKIETKSIDLKYNYLESSKIAYNTFRTGNILNDTKQKVVHLFKTKELGLVSSYNESALKENLSIIAGQIAIPSSPPSVKKTQTGIVVDPGEMGQDIDTGNLMDLIKVNVKNADFSPIQVRVTEIDPTLTENEVITMKKEAEKLLGKEFALTFEGRQFIYKDTEIIPLIDARDKINQAAFEKILAELSNQIEREPQNAVFEYKDNKVQEFLPAKKGVSIEKDSLKEIFIENIKLLSSNQKVTNTNIPIKETDPEITTDEVNSLGIKDLLGRGTSRCRGSSAGRVHNIALASSKFKGVLVKPNETFSFNEVLGDVSTFTGYKQAYVIKDGKTVLGDGGGVCQVSTTLFRAILDSGLPIIERNPHSYRVSYYEQDSKPGIDATIYSPYVDLKFKNNTSNHLLIQTEVDTNSYFLSFEIYGTPDGRKVTMTDPVILSSTPPPEDKYVDDPSLPQGEIEQIEHKAWGAKVSFDYKVTKDNSVIYEKTFYSNYRPWQAVYLRGTGPTSIQ